MVDYTNATYRRYDGSNWETIHFKTNAGQVAEIAGTAGKQHTDGKRFLVPGTHTVNGKYFFDLSNNTAQAIVLDGYDILVGGTVTGLNNLSVGSALANMNQSIDNLRDIVGQSVVTMVKTPTMTTGETGVVDLTDDFALYLPLTGGTLTGALEATELKASNLQIEDRGGVTVSIEPNATFGGNVTVSGTTTIGGDLVVNGTTTTVNSTVLAISDNLITLAKGNTTALTNPAGFVVPNYDGTNYGALYFDSTGTAWVGDVSLSGDQIDTTSSSASRLVTRTADDYDDLSLMVWDKATKSIKSSQGRIIGTIEEATNAWDIVGAQGLQTYVENNFYSKKEKINASNISDLNIDKIGSWGDQGPQIGTSDTVRYALHDANASLYQILNNLLDDSAKVFYGKTSPTNPHKNDAWIYTG